jgi:hypothetical protein
MTDLTAPLTPPDCDISDFDRMALDIKRMRGSKFDAGLDDSAWRAGLNLWMSAWHARPAASLDNDDEALTVAAGLRDLKKWKRIKTKAMLEHWVLCSDGRLYHKTLSELALEAWLEKLSQRKSSGAGNAKRWGAKFDPDQVQADIDIACEHLERLNPDSRALVKARRRHGKRIPDGTEKPGAPQSHRDKTPQGEKSQGNGMEGNGEEEAKPSPTEPEAAHGATSTVEWIEKRLPLILGKVANLDPTSPGIRNIAALRKLEAEGLDFELDILPALIAVGASWNNPRRPIYSWGLRAFGDMAHANHQRRTETRDASAIAHDGRTRTPGPKLGGLRRAALQDQARRASEPGEHADDVGGDRDQLNP